jgi:hypothetical protein
MTHLIPMADAAFAANIPPGYDIAGGYYGGPNAYRVWPAAEWDLFPGYKLPIWVGGDEGHPEGQEAAAELAALGVPAGSITVLDMETRKDRTYVAAFGAAMQQAGYRVWVYGSAATVGLNPPLNGYWIADYTDSAATIDHLLGLPHVRAVQYANLPGFDKSWVKAWTEGEMWHG